MELKLELHGKRYGITCTVDEFLELSERLGVTKDDDKGETHYDANIDFINNYRGKEVIVKVSRVVGPYVHKNTIGPVIIDTYRAENGRLVEITVASLRYPEGITVTLDSPQDTMHLEEYKGGTIDGDNSQND